MPVQIRGAVCASVSDLVTNSLTIAEIWRFNGCQNGGRPPSWIF